MTSQELKPSRALKIALVSPLPPPMGGIAKWTSLIHDHLSRDSDVELRIVDIAVRSRGIHQLTPLRRVASGGMQLLLGLSRLIWVMIKFRPDVVHLNTSGQIGLIRDLAMTLTCRAFQKPVVLHIRFGRVPEIANMNTFEWRLLKLVLRSTSAVITLDARTRQTLEQAARSPAVFQIPNFLDEFTLPPLTSVQQARKTVTFVGWISKSKGVEDLLEAWSLSNTMDWRLQLIGPCDPEYSRSLRARFDFESVELVGELASEHALQEVAGCGVFTLPSHTEGFPNAVLEAMALGRPIIATAVGAIPQMLGNGAGILVESQNVPELVLALNRLILRASERRLLSEASRARFQAEFQSSSTISKYKSIWISAKSNKRGFSLG